MPHEDLTSGSHAGLLRRPLVAFMPGASNVVDP
jgi:hypothetical protein